MSPYLLYVLVNYDVAEYMQMFNIFISSLISSSQTDKFDILIICDKNVNTREFDSLKSHFNKVFVLQSHTHETKLGPALLRKFDICEFSEFNSYKKIMYLDVDILLQDDLMKVFKLLKILQKEKLYVTPEGTPDKKWWALPRENVSLAPTFNSGFYMFKPSKEMQNHFKTVKEFAMVHQKQCEVTDICYDQNYFNFYFNRNNLVIISQPLANVYQMFPDPKTLYSDIIILHFSGLGQYKDKVRKMNNYILKLKK